MRNRIIIRILIVLVIVAASIGGYAAHTMLQQTKKIERQKAIAKRILQSHSIDVYTTTNAAFSGLLMDEAVYLYDIATGEQVVETPNSNVAQLVIEDLYSRNIGYDAYKELAPDDSTYMIRIVYVNNRVPYLPGIE